MTKERKRKASGAYGKQHKDKCIKCGKYGHKSTDQKCPENLKKK